MRPISPGFTRIPFAATLAFLLIAEPLIAATPALPPRQEKALHALNRLTFGPRPGDVARVESMGLDAWFEQQLNPASIDDSALDARLADYPAMQLPESELIRRYPGPAQIRQIVRQGEPLPSDPTLHAVYADAIAFYQMRQEEKAAKKPDDPDKAVPQSDLAPLDTASAHIEESFPQSQARAIIAQPPAQRFQTLLTLPAPDLARLRKSLTAPELAALADGLTPSQRETLQALPGSLRMIAAETLETRLLRDLDSNRQLEAVMTDFWLNHFNVYLKKNQQAPYQLSTYERETIRAHALGHFEDLLVATAESPAMLTYLDNARSIGPDSRAAQRIQRLPNAKASAGLNENYGRELMELHTLGVGGGYTQADVTQVAKVFTGWTIARPFQGGGFTFDERRHEPGTKLVLGHTIRESGQQEGLQVLHLLATSPATARFISTKLAVRFVSDDPPPTLVDKMTKTFLASNGDIKAVLRTMFHAPEFWPPQVYRAKVKTPLEFVVSAARAADIEVTNPLGLVQSLDKLGMPLYGMQTPNGYSWKQAEWVGTGALVSRMNFALTLAGDKLPGTRTQWSSLLADTGAKALPVSFDATSPVAPRERKLELLLLGEPVSDRTRATVLGQSSDPAVAQQAATAFDLKGAGGKYAGGAIPRRPASQSPDDSQAAVMAGLLLGSPEFQRR
jgi:uncharacterized protein (DUF1800 family)